MKHSFHCILRRAFQWYHNWHNQSFHQDFHWLAFILIALSVTSFILRENISFANSFEPASIYLAESDPNCNYYDEDYNLIPCDPPVFKPVQPPTSQNLQAGQEFGQMISDVFNYALILVGISVFVMIMWGGILYLTSAANPGNIAVAKKKIYNAIIGVIILFSSYVILNTINPELVGDTIDLQGIQPPGPVIIPPGIDACSLCFAYPGGITAGGIPVKCMGLYVDTSSAIPVNDPNRTCRYTDAVTATKLVALREATRNWVLSEGFPPTVNHADSCHGNGSCVDITLFPRPSDALIIDELNRLCAAVRSAGFTTIINEYTSLASSWPAGPTNCPRPRSTPFRTGDHLHIER